MTIFKAIKCEFIKNYHLKNILIILGTLLLSVIILTENNIQKNNLDETINFNNLISINATNLEQNKYLSYFPLKQQFYEFYYYKEKEILEYLKNDVYQKDIINRQNDWQYNIYFHTILKKEIEIYLSNILINNRNDIDIQNILINPSSDLFDTNLYLLKDYSEKDLQNLQKNNEQEIKELKAIVNSNNYYQYYSYNYQYDDEFPKLQQVRDLVLARKITDYSNYNYENLFMYSLYFSHLEHQELMPLEEYKIMSINEFKQSNLKYDPSNGSTYYSYDTYKNSYKFLGQNALAKKMILEYALQNNLPSDLLANKDGHLFTAKSNVNTISKLSFVIILLIVLTSVNIITSEFNKGTIKILFTSGIKRWKIFLSKFLYLVIHSYLLWLVLFIILYIYSGLKFGFQDLFYPELIFNGSKVIELNYLIYILIEITIINIPVVAFISLILLVSTIFMNNVFPTMFGTFLGLITSCIWFLINEFHLYFLLYSVIPYFNLYEIISVNNLINISNYFTEAMRFVSTSLDKGLIISLLTIIINYLIANYLFMKKEI